MLEQFLVNLGLAEAPPPPVDMGNPDTQVWVDVHTALYYCPGGDFVWQDGRWKVCQPAGCSTRPVSAR